MPTFDVQPTYYARAIGVGVGVAIGGGVLWIIFNALFGGFGVLSSIPALAIGYASGELISKSVNAKRSNGLAYIAAGAVVGAFIIVLFLSSSPVTASFWGLIVLAVSIYSAVQRVKKLLPDTLNRLPQDLTTETPSLKEPAELAPKDGAVFHR